MTVQLWLMKTNGPERSVPNWTKSSRTTPNFKQLEEPKEYPNTIVQNQERMEKELQKQEAVMELEANQKEARIQMEERENPATECSAQMMILQSILRTRLARGTLALKTRLMPLRPKHQRSLRHRMLQRIPP